MFANQLFYTHLIQNNFLPDDDTSRAILELANNQKTYMYRVLIDQKKIKIDDMYHILSKYFKFDFIQVNALSLDDQLIQKIGVNLLKDLQCIPIRIQSERLLVGIADPYRSIDIHQLVSFFEDVDVKVVLVTEDNLANLFEYIENKHRKSEVIDTEDTAEELKNIADNDLILANSPAVKFADSILREAVASRASDIHIEPFEDYVRVRFRLDGHLIDNTKLSRSMYPSILVRFKIIANLNIAERRIPQDGKIKLKINQEFYDFRISTIPTIHGEKIVVRVYDSQTSHQGVVNIGLFEEQLKIVHHMIHRPYGMILVTGPTGSGKSTTLYAFLKSLKHSDFNITTIEDPVENRIDGVNQIQVNPKANVTFSTALRAILRQDPNIIMIGEIRDEETAQMAIRAAITGHLVFSTLHTNDAIGAITRMADMGVPRYLLADALLGAIAQRLVRKLCSNCKRSAITTAAEADRLKLKEPQMIYHPIGCRECHQTGYYGRQAVFEVIGMTHDMKQMIENTHVHVDEIRDKVLSSQTMMIIDSCRRLVLEGITSIEEYDALTSFENK